MRNGPRNRTFQAALAITFSLVIAASAGTDQVKPAGSEDEQLIFNVCVTERGGAPVVGLGREDFSILIDRAPAEIGYFSGRDAPESISLVVDVSGSMKRRALWKPAVSQLSRVVALSNPGSEFLLVAFNDAPQLVADWTSDQKALIKAITSLGQREPKGSTAFYDACQLAINKAAQAKTRKKFILLVTDGQDNSSRTSLNKLRRSLESSTVPVYCIGLIDLRDALASNAWSVVQDLTSLSGGAVLFPFDAQQLVQSVRQPAWWMRHGYQIGVSRAAIPKDSKYHRFSLKVGSPNAKGDPAYFVTAPKGFRTP